MIVCYTVIVVGVSVKHSMG